MTERIAKAAVFTFVFGTIILSVLYELLGWML